MITMHESISTPPRRRRRLFGPLAVVLVLLLVVGALDHWNTNEYAITPGSATPVAPLVKITGLSTEKHHDDFMLVDVWLQQLTAWQYLVMHLQRHVEFVNGNELLSPGVPASQLTAQGYLEMADAKQAAEVAAFRALGWRVPATPAGAILTEVLSKTPAARAQLHVGDEVTALNGHAVTSSCALVGAMNSVTPGTSVTLTVRRVHTTNAGVMTWPHVAQVTATAAKAPRYLQAMGCPNVKGAPRSWLGVSVEDGFDYVVPATVSINTAGIGGPSAGLAMTLSLIDKLDRGALANGQRVAVTGTIDQYGNVGDVGGVAEKTVAAANAGAKYFMVPQVEVPTALANAPAGLKIIGVTTLDQALRDLHALGGQWPLTPLTTPH